MINGDRRRVAAPRRRRRAHAGVAGERLASAARRRRAEVRHDPGRVRLRPARVASTRRCRRSPAAGDDAKVITGGQSLLPLLRMRLAAPSLLVDCSRLDEMRGVTDDGDALRHRRRHHAPRGHARPARGCARAAAGRGRRRRSADPAIRHRGTFGGSLAHADPAATCRPWRWRSACSWTSWARAVAARSPRRTSSSTTSPRRWPPTRCSCRGADPQARRRVGLRLHEVPPHRAGVGDRRSGGRRAAGERQHRRGPGGPDEHGFRADPRERDRVGAVRGECVSRCGARRGRARRRRHRPPRATCTRRRTSASTWRAC